MQPWRITIDTNPDICNLHCIMCDTHSRYNKNFKNKRLFMDKDLLIKSIDESLKIGVKEIIPSTMGEPLLYKYFDIFIDKLSYSTAKLNLTTNGTFPGGVELWAKRLLPVLSDIKISINGINSEINEKIMLGDNTQKKIGDIKKFIFLRDKINPNASITLQVTFLKSNLNELENIIKFAIKNNIDRVKGHHLWVNYKEMENESLRFRTDIPQWNSFIKKIGKYKKVIKLVNFEKLSENISFEEVPHDYECPFICKEIWLDHEGSFNICCAPSNERITLGNWGNIKDRTIINIFNSPEYINFVENYKSKKVCKKCSLRRPI